MVSQRTWLHGNLDLYHEVDTWENLDGFSVEHRWLDGVDAFQPNDLTLHMKHYQDSPFVASRLSDSADSYTAYFVAKGFFTRHLYYNVFIEIYDRFDREWIVEDGFDFWNQHFHESIDVHRLYSFVLWTNDAIHRSK